MRLWLALTAVVFALLSVPAPAKAYTARWLRQARCIHHYETRRPWSRGWHLTKDWLGRPSVNHGGLQTNVGTWRAYAPRSFPTDPASASRAQQLLVSWRIFVASGRSWRQWSTWKECVG